MTVSLLVLGSVLLSILALIALVTASRRIRSVDPGSIHDVAQLEAAIAAQRSLRILELQRRMSARNPLSLALIGVAFLTQIAAITIDRLAHPSIAVVSMLPAFFVVITAGAARRRYAQRQLQHFLRHEGSLY